MVNYKIPLTYSSLKEADKEDKPREKLLRLGAEALTDKELIMLLVGSGSQFKRVDDIAEEVLEKLDRGLPLTKINGLGDAKTTAIYAALEIGRRRVTKRPRIITSPKSIYDEIRHYASREKEHLIVLLLNGANEVIKTFVATIGLVDQALVHPREVFGPALTHHASAIVIAHNHPSGNLVPSEDDKVTTKRLKKSGDLLGIKVLDHLIFSENEFFSFMEHSLL